MNPLQHCTPSHNFNFPTSPPSLPLNTQSKQQLHHFSKSVLKYPLANTSQPFQQFIDRPSTIQQNYMTKNDTTTGTTSSSTCLQKYIDDLKMLASQKKMQQQQQQQVRGKSQRSVMNKKNGARMVESNQKVKRVTNQEVQQKGKQRGGLSPHQLIEQWLGQGPAIPTLARKSPAQQSGRKPKKSASKIFSPSSVLQSTDPSTEVALKKYMNSLRSSEDKRLKQQQRSGSAAVSRSRSQTNTNQKQLVTSLQSQPRQQSLLKTTQRITGDLQLNPYGDVTNSTTTRSPKSAKKMQRASSYSVTRKPTVFETKNNFIQPQQQNILSTTKPHQKLSNATLSEGRCEIFNSTSGTAASQKAAGIKSPKQNGIMASGNKSKGAPTNTSQTLMMLQEMMLKSNIQQMSKRKGSSSRRGDKNSSRQHGTQDLRKAVTNAPNNVAAPLIEGEGDFITNININNVININNKKTNSLNNDSAAQQAVPPHSTPLSYWSAPATGGVLMNSRQAYTGTLLGIEELHENVVRFIQLQKRVAAERDSCSSQAPYGINERSDDDLNYSSSLSSYNMTSSNKAYRKSSSNTAKKRKNNAINTFSTSSMSHYQNQQRSQNNPQLQRSHSGQLIPILIEKQSQPYQPPVNSASSKYNASSSVIQQRLEQGNVRIFEVEEIIN